jgi:nickel/cobalt transporter (NicO) family protein
LPPGNTAVLVIAVAAAAVGNTAVSAHRLDECLQAARIGVAPDRVEIELDVTPGTAVADAILSDIDGNGDGSLSQLEQGIYVRRVLGSVDVVIDDRATALIPGPSTFPSVDALRLGEGTVRLRAVAAIPDAADGNHRVLFRNRYRGDVSVYLANALVPESNRVAITGQRHEAGQRELEIDYVVGSGPSTSTVAWVLGGMAALLAVLLVRPSTAR